MTPLAKLLVQRIISAGPISLADFIADCLLHPTHGYYSTRDPLGAGGDFTTAPEISQMFGELIGLSLAKTWVDQGRPGSLTLAELGPGRGTLMADIMRATKSVSGFHAAAHIHLIEASPLLRARQRETLGDLHPTWIGNANDLPAAPLYLVANEFFDALPIRQFVRDGSAWRERQVGVQDGALTLGLGATAPVAALDHRIGDTKPGDIVEICPTAQPIIRAITARIADRGGAALIIDYGGWRTLGDTFQALMAHETADPLADPGLADLTAHVDFEALTIAARDVSHTRLTTQGVFLERLGITQRAQNLAINLSGAQLDAHVAAHRRLTHPAEMGSLFKVLGLFPNGMSPPPGLDP